MSHILHNIYDISENEKILVCSEYLNKDNDPIEKVLYNNDMVMKTLITYHKPGLVQTEKFFEDDTEYQKIVYEYDAQDRVIKQESYAYGEILQTIITTYSNKKMTHITYQEGKEIYREVESDLDESSTLYESYTDGYRNDYTIITIDKEKKQKKIEDFDVYDELKSITIEVEDDNGNMIESIEIDTNEEIIKHIKQEYQQDNIIRASFMEKVPDSKEEFYEFGYDQNNRWVSTYITGPRGLTIGNVENKYDNKNMLTEEKGLQGGSYYSITKEYYDQNKQAFHYFHEYNEVK